MTKKIFVCPDCEKPIKVWVDVDGCCEFKVSSTGSISKGKLEFTSSGDTRLGVKCTSCSWEMHCDDDDDGYFEKVFNQLADKIDPILTKAQN